MLDNLKQKTKDFYEEHKEKITDCGYGLIGIGALFGMGALGLFTGYKAAENKYYPEGYIYGYKDGVTKGSNLKIQEKEEH
jgi:hypothetical protein